MGVSHSRFVVGAVLLASCKRSPEPVVTTPPARDAAPAATDTCADASTTEQEAALARLLQPSAGERAIPAVPPCERASVDAAGAALERWMAQEKVALVSLQVSCRGDAFVAAEGRGPASVVATVVGRIVSGAFVPLAKATFTEGSHAPSKWVRALVTTDLDGDGLRDVVVGEDHGVVSNPNPSRTLTAYLAKGARAIAQDEVDGSAVITVVERGGRRRIVVTPDVVLRGEDAPLRALEIVGDRLVDDPPFARTLADEVAPHLRRLRDAKVCAARREAH